ncbi:MAG TPA: glycerophosphodiester phosphodiesterase family protein [Chitinophagaceae bacterium]|nr:glycerophosphodiester phosphodiesterase family protein [Chitinophagaceae bacterium]
MKKLILPASVLLLMLGGCKPPQKTTSGTKPLVLPAFNKEGHRGTRGLMPENVIPSMYKALDHRVNTVEVDVVISKDKKVVVSHDVYFHPDITTTPDGKSLDSKEAAKHLLYTMDYDSIKKYDVGLKPYPLFPRQKKMMLV